MNTFREVQALILGYRAADDVTRRKILQLVPDLTDLVADAPPADRTRRWLLKATDENDREVMTREVISRQDDLHLHVVSLVSALPYTSGVSVVWSELPG